MIILGLDIGYGKCGYSLLERTEPSKQKGNSRAISNISNTGKILSIGTITTPKTEEISSRLTELSKDLKHIRDKYNPQTIVIEKLYYYRRNTVFEKICMAKGIAYLVFHPIRIIEIEPKIVKKEIIGHGNATKSDIRQALKKIMTHDIKGVSDDALDAYCLSLYGDYLLKYEEKFKEAT